jgi:hypothetical protein
METVSVQVDSKWARIIRSPIYWVVTALTGVSVTFFPAYLLELGRNGHTFFDWQVLLLWITTVAVTVVHFRLSTPVIRALRTGPSSSAA